MKSSSDGAYTRSAVFDSLSHVDDPVGPEIRAVMKEFEGHADLAMQVVRVGLDMRQFGLDPSLPENRQKAAEVLRTRLSAPQPWIAHSQEKHRQRVAIEQVDGQEFVYYLDLYGAAIKIGYSAHLLKRLSSLRRRPEHLLAIEPAGRATESLRHVEFSVERHRGTEDFERSPRLLAHIDKLRQQYGEPAELIARSAA